MASNQLAAMSENSSTLAQRSSASMRSWKTMVHRLAAIPLWSRCLLFLVTTLIVRFFRQRVRTSERRSSSLFQDPTFGDALGLVYNRSRMGQSWEEFLDALGLKSDTPFRGHLRQLFDRTDWNELFLQLYDALVDGEDRFTKYHCERFSRGIGGQLHILLNKKTKTPLLPVSDEDMVWVTEAFDTVFPAERPLERESFPAFAKTVLTRRVVRTLIKSVGIDSLRGGTAAPLVVDVAVDLGNGHQPPESQLAVSIRFSYRCARIGTYH